MFVPGLQNVALIELRQAPYFVPGLTHVVALSRRPGDGKSYITCKDKRFKSISNGKNSYCFVDENLMLLDLKRVHVDGHAFGLKLDRCAGDCDRNSHCATGLSCYQRGDNRQIPGCAKGGKGDVRGWDYCYAAPSKCTSKNSDATIMADLKKLCPKCKF